MEISPLGSIVTPTKMIHHWLEHILAALTIPELGLSTVFVMSLLSATLLPFASEPTVYGVIALNRALFWPVIAVATLGNTLGGAISWWLGYGSQTIATKVNHSALQLKALNWLDRLGPKACLLSWLPIIGDPLCFIAGWLKMPFWRSVLYMMIGKFLRYLLLTTLLLFTLPDAPVPRPVQPSKNPVSSALSHALPIHAHHWQSNI